MTETQQKESAAREFQLQLRDILLEHKVELMREFVTTFRGRFDYCLKEGIIMVEGQC